MYTNNLWNDKTHMYADFIHKNTFFLNEDVDAH